MLVQYYFFFFLVLEFVEDPEAEELEDELLDVDEIVESLSLSSEEEPVPEEDELLELLLELTFLFFLDVFCVFFGSSVTNASSSNFCFFSSTLFFS